MPPGTGISVRLVQLGQKTHLPVMYIYIYTHDIYIYRERERERERDFAGRVLEASFKSRPSGPWAVLGDGGAADGPAAATPRQPTQQIDISQICMETPTYMYIHI